MTTRNMQILYKLFMMLVLAMVVSCGTNGSQSASTGDITAKLAWDSSEKTTAKMVASAPAGVTTVRIIISAADMTDIKKDFTAASGSGTIDGVPPGTGRSLTAQGLDGTGAVIYQGTAANLTVQAGQTTNAGTITMATATPAPKLSFDLTSLTFAPQDNFTTSAAQTVVLSNTGNTGILLYSDGITWPMFAQWIITNDTCPYQPSIFAAGTSCSISIVFKPSGDDTLRINYSLQQQLGYSPSPIPPDSYSGAFEVHGDSVTNPQIAVPKLAVHLNGTGVYPLSTPTVAVPAITGISPSTGTLGTTVTITGTNFSTTPANNTVKFNGTQATLIAGTATTLTVTVPNGATSGTVSVANAGGTATSSGSFTVTTPTPAGTDAKNCLSTGFLTGAAAYYNDKQTLTNNCSVKIYVMHCHSPSSLPGTSSSECGVNDRFYQAFYWLAPGEVAANQYNLPPGTTITYGACSGGKNPSLPSGSQVGMAGDYICK